LEVFYFGDNQIRDLSPLKNLKKLLYIGIGDNPIQDISVLYELPNLSIILASNLKHLEAEFDKLREVNPNCVIYH
jgi:Leucine-rich repeat (LRR) protein